MLYVKEESMMMFNNIVDRKTETRLEETETVRMTGKLLYVPKPKLNHKIGRKRLFFLRYLVCFKSVSVTTKIIHNTHTESTLLF